MNTEAGSGLTIRALLTGLREQASAAQACVDVTNLAQDDKTHLTVHYWPEDRDRWCYCECGRVIKP